MFSEWCLSLNPQVEIFAFEPMPLLFETMEERLSSYQNQIHFFNYGICSKTERIPFFFNSQKTMQSSKFSSFLNPQGEKIEVNMISFSQILEEYQISQIDLIKMDIEGFEIPAIIGAKKHIINDQPKLAICLYHILSDIWEIPKLIDALLPKHRFYMRHYREDENWETVLYVIPPEQELVINPIHTAVTILPDDDRPWSNVELIKDCGMLPYLLYKNHGMDVTMVGTSGDEEEYPYSALVEGMKLLSLGSYDHKTKLEYLAHNAKNIDLLILRGGYEISAVMAKTYKKYNPNGLIYCGLDANSSWMDRLEWYNKDYKWFIDNCDVLATSCTAMAELLTKKWHRKVDVLTNGFYDLFGMNLKDSRFEDKENVIFTAARLGSEQKATDLLLNAFALIANDIPGWTLRLAGSVANEFIPFREKYFGNHPELEDRVLFLGEITDRKELAREYQKAKVFALPSAWEGGTPNAASEALYSGCVMAVTKFDAWEDCIGKGKCGEAVNTGDTEGFANVLKNLCLNADLKKMSESAIDYAKDMFDMEKNVLWLFNRLKERTVR